MLLLVNSAVVGTSGNLLYYHSGASIDSHDAVFRFNAATTQGFEDFVGSKTTVRAQFSGRGGACCGTMAEVNGCLC